MSQCKSCGASIIWLRTTSGRLMPIDASPTANGNIVIVNGCAVIQIGETIQDRFTSHFATCPNAATHRRSK